MNLVHLAKQYADGIRILRDWLGDDYAHVEKEEAQRRADICRKCDKNTLGWKAPEAVAEAIREQAELRLKMDMKVDGESDIMTCKVCKCHLPLKIWLPKDKLLRYSTPKDVAKYDDKCWLRE